MTASTTTRAPPHKLRAHGAPRHGAAIGLSALFLLPIAPALAASPEPYVPADEAVQTMTHIGTSYLAWSSYRGCPGLEFPPTCLISARSLSSLSSFSDTLFDNSAGPRELDVDSNEQQEEII